MWPKKQQTKQPHKPSTSTTHHHHHHYFPAAPADSPGGACCNCGSTPKCLGKIQAPALPLLFRAFFLCRLACSLQVNGYCPFTIKPCALLAAEAASRLGWDFADSRGSPVGSNHPPYRLMHLSHQRCHEGRPAAAAVSVPPTSAPSQ